MNPLISIITPSYNQGQFIEETILSVLNQSYKNIQYIIVDGGSNDSTMSVVNKYLDQIDIVIHERDKGQADAINKGFELAKGELVGWINSDDLLYPECVEKIVELYLENPNGVIFYSRNIDRITASGELFQQVEVLINDKNTLIKHNYDVIQQGSFYTISVVRKVGYLNESIHYCMDLDLWLRLLEYGSIHSYPTKALAAFRAWEESKTSTGNSKFFIDIEKVLTIHGAKWTDYTMLKLKYLLFKEFVKRKIFLNNGHSI
jgi:glycosyltransferase involved in cell wall biosynthesis